VVHFDTHPLDVYM